MAGTRDRRGGEGSDDGLRRSFWRERGVRLRWLSGALSAAALLLATVPATGLAAEVRLVRNATTEFAPFLTDSNPAAQDWMRNHYFQMRGYSPYFENNAFEWSPPPTSFYRDLYAIYNNPTGRQLIANHPDWVLRDGAGRPLYIPYGCSGGSCPQYAADVGNPGWRAHWIAGARATFDNSRSRSRDGSGYAGVFIDDVNMTMHVGNGNGADVAPNDPRTGGPMTQQSWQRYVAEFTEQIRAAFPDKQITHNPLWWMPRSDPEVRRQIAAADVIEIERGFTDPGLVGGTSKYGHETLMRHIDWLHNRGKAVVLEPYMDTVAEARFELANYLLVRGRGDSISTAFRADPPAAGGHWWKRWALDPGKARGRRFERGGVWIRHLRRGTAIVNPPGAPPRNVRFKRPRRSLSGKISRHFRLEPREGDFFRKRRQG
jgi:hypothetical protein